MRLEHNGQLEFHSCLYVWMLCCKTGIVLQLLSNTFVPLHKGFFAISMTNLVGHLANSNSVYVCLDHLSKSAIPAKEVTARKVDKELEQDYANHNKKLEFRSFRA